MTGPDRGDRMAAARLRADLDRLADTIEAVPFALPSPARPRRMARRDEAVWTIREYLLTRLHDVEAPAVVVIVGSTGSGKSTLLNSLAGAPVSRPGAVRPTTMAPVVWAHERHTHLYESGFLTGYGTGPEAERPLTIVASDEPLLEGLTIVDAPDFDSIVELNREIVDDLLAVADLALFVTSAQRYADAVPWTFLERAARRRLPVLFVMNRLPPGDIDEIVADYARRLRERGVLHHAESASFLRIAEQQVDRETGGLPAAAVAPLRDRLEALGDRSERLRIVRQATRGAVDESLAAAGEIRDEVVAERSEIDGLVRAARHAYDRQAEELRASLVSGTLIRGEVLRRWQRSLGTGELMETVADGLGKVRAWARQVLGGAPGPVAVQREAHEELALAVVRRASLAAEAAATAWDLDPTGRRLLADAGRSLWSADEATEERARRAIEDWMAELSRTIESESAGKRRTAQVASLGVNAAAVIVLLGVFSQTGGLTGAEVGIAAGAAAAQQKVLEHLIGTAAARSIVERARTRLDEALTGVLATDAARFVSLAERHGAPANTEQALDDAAEAVRGAAATFYADTFPADVGVRF